MDGYGTVYAERPGVTTITTILLYYYCSLTLLEILLILSYTAEITSHFLGLLEIYLNKTLYFLQWEDRCLTTYFDQSLESTVTVQYSTVQYSTVLSRCDPSLYNAVLRPGT